HVDFNGFFNGRHAFLHYAIFCESVRIELCESQSVGGDVVSSWSVSPACCTSYHDCSLDSRPDCGTLGCHVRSTPAPARVVRAVSNCWSTQERHNECSSRWLCLLS